MKENDKEKARIGDYVNILCYPEVEYNGVLIKDDGKIAVVKIEGGKTVSGPSRFVRIVKS